MIKKNETRNLLNNSGVGINRLPSDMRKKTASDNYAKAVKLYAATNLSLKTIAELTGVSYSGLTSHIRRHHRQLLFSRHNIPSGSQPQSLNNEENNQNTLYSRKIRHSKGQSKQTFLKYRDAIDACSSHDYIELTISEIARIFNLNPNGLASQLKYHFPRILTEREKTRQNLGLSDNKQRGARQLSIEWYADAVALYRDSDLPLTEVARQCNVTTGGLNQFLRFYHKDVIEAKAKRRKMALLNPTGRQPGTLAANGSLYGPLKETEEKYAKALQLYLTKPLTVKETAQLADVTYAGFAGYMKVWHRQDMKQRSGVVTAEKYKDAIQSLRENPRAVAKAAAQFGLNPDVFREYLKSHHPEIFSQQGMIKTSEGKRVKRSCEEKYRRAIDEFINSTQSMKEIALRHGIVYKSLMSFMKRNCPEVMENRRNKK